MTMFERIREAGFRFVSKLLNEDDDAGLDVGALEGDLRHFIHKVNRSSAARIIPLRRAG